MKTRVLLSALLLSAAAIAPASANWFSNPYLGINRCVCTAPSPTPEQVRANKLPPYVLREKDSSEVTVADATAEKKQTAQAPTQTAQAATPAR